MQKGMIKIRRYELREADTIALILDRKPEGKCRVHGAWEQNPKGIIPIDTSSHLPMLSFYGAEIS